MTRSLAVVIALLSINALAISAQQSPRQTQEDDYTRYELLAPDSAQFRIYYEVTATTPARGSSSTRFAREAWRPTSAWSIWLLDSR